MSSAETSYGAHLRETSSSVLHMGPSCPVSGEGTEGKRRREIRSPRGEAAQASGPLYREFSPPHSCSAAAELPFLLLWAKPGVVAPAPSCCPMSSMSLLVISRVGVTLRRVDFSTFQWLLSLFPPAFLISWALNNPAMLRTAHWKRTCLSAPACISRPATNIFLLQHHFATSLS